jgi:hypothetical protein
MKNGPDVVSGLPAAVTILVLVLLGAFVLHERKANERAFIRCSTAIPASFRGHVVRPGYVKGPGVSIQVRGGVCVYRDNRGRVVAKRPVP